MHLGRLVWTDSQLWTFPEWSHWPEWKAKEESGIFDRFEVSLLKKNIIPMWNQWVSEVIWEKTLFRVTDRAAPVSPPPLDYRCQGHKWQQNSRPFPTLTEKVCSRSEFILCLFALVFLIFILFLSFFLPAWGTPGSIVQRMWQHWQSDTAAARQPGWRFLLSHCCPTFHMNHTLNFVCYVKKDNQTANHTQLALTSF